MRIKISTRFFIAALLFWHSTLAIAATVNLTLQDPFVDTIHVDTSADLFYSYDITAAGFNPATDFVIEATLAIQFIDDNEDPFGSGTALYNFNSGDETELSVSEGDKITILNDYGEWFYARNELGEEGYVPASYIDVIILPQNEVFQLSFDGASQGVYDITGGLYNFSVPVAYFSDGILDLNIHAVEGDFIFYDADLNLIVEQVVPVPAAIWLFGSGLLGLIGFARQNNKN